MNHDPVVPHKPQPDPSLSTLDQTRQLANFYEGTCNLWISSQLKASPNAATRFLLTKTRDTDPDDCCTFSRVPAPDFLRI